MTALPRSLAYALLQIVVTPVWAVVSLLTFLLTSLLPGDPALQVLGGAEPSQEAIEAVTAARPVTS